MIITVLFFVLLPISEIPVSAAVKAPYLSISDDGTVTEYLGSDSELSIPEKLTSATGKKCTQITITGSKDSVLKSITVPEGYTTVYITEYPKLETINIPHSAKYIFIADLPSLKKFTTPTGNASIFIFNCKKLNEINLSTPLQTEEYDFISVCRCNSLKQLTVPEGFDGALISDNESLKYLALPDLLENLELRNLPSMAKLKLPAKPERPVIDRVPFDGITTLSNDYSIENGGMYAGETLIGIDTTKKKVEIKTGTRHIGYLSLSDTTATTEIVLPNTVESIDDFAFSGCHKLKTVNIPSSVRAIGMYAFEETAVKKLVLPASVTELDADALGGYTGSIALSGNSSTLHIYKSGLYRTVSSHIWDDTTDSLKEWNYSLLLYYPKSKKTLTLEKNCIGISASALVDTKFKKLTLPEGFRFLDFDLSGSAVTSISIPASVIVADESDTDSVARPVFSAPKLKKITLSADNGSFSVYKNCLYTKDLSTLIAAPRGLSTVSIYKDCTGAFDYAIEATPNSDGTYNKLEVTIPYDFSVMNNCSFTNAKIYVGSPIAKQLQKQKLSYTFIDANNEILDAVYVSEKLSVKKGKKKTIDLFLPAGLTQVKSISSGINSEITVAYASSDTKIATVTDKGAVKGIKKGKCTVTVTLTIGKGKKQTVKKLSIPVTVK